MKPTFSNLKKLVLKNCKSKNCEMFQFKERKLIGDRRCKHIDYKNFELCTKLKDKFDDWNLLFFPNRPCDKCIVKPMCIYGAKWLTPKIVKCDSFSAYYKEIENQYKKGRSEVLKPELSLYTERIINFLDHHWFRW